MNTTRLTVPAADATENPGTITLTQELQLWVDELPYANPLQTAKQLLKSLSQLNRHPGRIANRAELMACYQPPFHQLVNQAKKKHHGNRHRGAAELYGLTERITAEIAYGYKIVLREQNYFRHSRWPVEQQANLIYQALEGLILSLLFTFAEHRQEPHHTWGEILQLYLLAEQLGLPKEPADSPLNESDGGSDIRALLKTIVLILLLDPYKLQQNEIWQAYSYLGWWGDHALITRFKSAEEGTGRRYVIDFDSHAKPHPFDPVAPPENSDNCLLFDAAPLCQLINRQLQGLQSKILPTIPGLRDLSTPAVQQLFHNMLVAWLVHPSRRYPREERYNWLIIACGITDIAHFLRCGGIVNAPTTEDEPDEERVIIEDTLSPYQEVTHNTFQWRQTNVSKSGVGLEIDPIHAGSVQVGQLVLMESERPNGEESWMIGVVRRLILRKKNRLEAGVQFVQGRVSAATIKPKVFGTTDAADFQPALLLDRGKKYSAAIFTPHLLYHPKREYFVEPHQGRVCRIFADKLLESTNCFQRFEYHQIQLHGQDGVSSAR